MSIPKPKSLFENIKLLMQVALGGVVYHFTQPHQLGRLSYFYNLVTGAAWHNHICFVEYTVQHHFTISIKPG